MCDFLNSFSRSLSGYYGPAGVRILLSTREGEPAAAPGDASVAAMHARLHLCAAFRQVIDNGLDLLMIKCAPAAARHSTSRL